MCSVETCRKIWHLWSHVIIPLVAYEDEFGKIIDSGKGVQMIRLKVQVIARQVFIICKKCLVDLGMFENQNKTCKFSFFNKVPCLCSIYLFIFCCGSGLIIYYAYQLIAFFIFLQCDCSYVRLLNVYFYLFRNVNQWTYLQIFCFHVFHF